MLYEMKQKDDIKNIMKYGKAYGAFLLHYLLHDICDINNFYVFDSARDYEKIKDKLPERFILRADAKVGEKPTLGVRGMAASKENVEGYIADVKAHNPDGVVLLVDTDTESANKTIDGSFNVYFEWGKKIFIDYLGQGFDVGGITKGEDNHEMWVIDWEDILFVTSNNMNQYRTYLISDEAYKQSAKRKRNAIVNKNKMTIEEAEKIIPDTYKPMPCYVKQDILDKIILQIYEKKDELQKLGLRSFGVQGMIRGGKLFPVEINRRERFVELDDIARKNDEKKDNNENAR